MSTAAPSELNTLTALSARLGANPLLVQAATGNTSLKIDGALWVKASGHWLSRAQATEIFVRTDRARILHQVEAGCDLGSEQTTPSGHVLRTSVETAMHAVLPWPVVLHVHSVNTIAWAVRADGRARLSESLRGLPWAWVPYVLSGIPLAREIERAIAASPGVAIFILANHGLVVCGRSCAEAEALLEEVEARLAIEPRRSRPADFDLLARLSSPGWQLPANPMVHLLATDPEARKILAGGILYPCQAIFLAPVDGMSPYQTIEGVGVLLRHNATPVVQETLSGLASVASRLEAGAPLRYLSESEVAELLSFDVYQYRDLVEANDARVSALL